MIDWIKNLLADDGNLDLDTDTDCMYQDEIYDAIKNYFFYLPENGWTLLINADNLVEVNKKLKKNNITISDGLFYLYGDLYMRDEIKYDENDSSNVKQHKLLQWFFDDYRDGYGMHRKNPRVLFDGDDWNELDEGESYD